MTEDNLPLAEQIDRDLRQAMRDRDDITKNTLRSVKTAMTEASKSGEQHEQSEDEILAVIQKQAKQRRDAAAEYERLDAAERAAGERSLISSCPSTKGSPLSPTSATSPMRTACTS